MNASPFASYEEFANATGAIYSFAHMPAVNGVLVAIGAAFFVFFIVKSFLIKH